MSTEAKSSPIQEHTSSSTLQSNAIGLPGVLFQSVTTMAPASAVAFSLGAAIPFTGGALPLAVGIALIACILVALNIGSLAKHLPSAGGYFTYVSRGLGPEVGWLTGWLFTFVYILVVPLCLLVLGPVSDTFMSTTFHISLGSSGWAVYALIFAAIIFCLTYFGIKISADAGVILGAIEVVVFLVLSTWLIITAGSSNTLATFNPASSFQNGLGGWQGVLFGMLFVFLAFAGFESSAILGEETRNPRRTVPRAILLAAVCIGIFYIFCSYAGIVGWGMDKIADFPKNSNPWGALASRVWGPLAFIVILTILNSGLANANSGVIAGARILYAMGRIKAFPGVFGRLNRYATPGLSVILVLVLGSVFALVSGLILGPSTAFSLTGALLTVPILLVYATTCLSVPFFYLREHRSEFRVLRHVILPAIPFCLLIVVVYFQFMPLPAAPLNLVGPIDAAWLVLGIIYMFVLRKRSPEVLAQGHKLFGEQEAAS